MSTIIREATDADAGLLADLIRRSFQTVALRFSLTAANCPKHPSNCTDEWVGTALDKGIDLFILEENGTPCGCVALEHPQPGLWYLERLAVLPDYRRKGYGESLVARALEHARNHGGDHISIGIIADHTELKQWYERLGFTVQQERVRFDHLPFTVTFLALPL